MTSNAGTSVLRGRGLRKEYGTAEALVRAVDGVSLDVMAGETVAVMGPSGCGKSTLLHLLGGLDPAHGRGTVAGGAGRGTVAGGAASQPDRERGLARFRRDAVGFVFQAFHLMDELTAVENVELPALLAGRSPRAARRRAAGLLERVGLADRAGFLPSALSGGQRQRVAIARALLADPLVVLADEPTGNLDSEATLDVLRLLDSLHAAGQQALVIVAHDSRIAATADRLISMRVGVGDRVTLNGQPFTVTRTAVTAANPPYPNLCYSGGGGCQAGPQDADISPGEMGLLWLTEPAAHSIATFANPLATYVLNLKLNNPASAPAFAARYGSSDSPAAPSMASWQGIAAADACWCRTNSKS